MLLQGSHSRTDCCGTSRSSIGVLSGHTLEDKRLGLSRLGRVGDLVLVCELDVDWSDAA